MSTKIKKGFCFMLACVMLLPLTPWGALAVTEDTEPPFTDIADHWAADAIRFVYEKGIMRGTSETTFSPDQSFSREMMTAALFRLHHDRAANESDPRAHPFTDVTGWAVPYIAWAFEAGLIKGKTETTFAPTVPISRQDSFVMLYRFAEFLEVNIPGWRGQLDRFPDAYLVDSWAVGAVNWAVTRGLIRGLGDNLEPLGTTDRAQTATLIERFAVRFTHPPEPLSLCPEMEARIIGDWTESFGRAPNIAGYFGTYGGSVALIINPGWHTVVWIEEVAGRVFFYTRDYRVLVWNDGAFYTLSGIPWFNISFPGAYELGLLTAEDIWHIHFRYEVDLQNRRGSA